MPSHAVGSQAFPTKPIHLIVPYPAGGGTDFFARLVGQKMSELIGQPIVDRCKRSYRLNSLPAALTTRPSIGWFAPM